MAHHATIDHDPFHGAFFVEATPSGPACVTPPANPPTAIPDPQGRLLRIATVDAKAQAICPSCAESGLGGYLSFVQDLRLAYACPRCQTLVWLNGA